MAESNCRHEFPKLGCYLYNNPCYSVVRHSTSSRLEKQEGHHRFGSAPRERKNLAIPYYSCALAGRSAFGVSAVITVIIITPRLSLVKNFFRSASGRRYSPPCDSAQEIAAHTCRTLVRCEPTPRTATGCGQPPSRKALAPPHEAHGEAASASSSGRCNSLGKFTVRRT